MNVRNSINNSTNVPISNKLLVDALSYEFGNNPCLMQFLSHKLIITPGLTLV